MGTHIDFNSITASAAAIAAVASLIALILTYFQLKQFRFAHGVDLIFELEDRFDAPEMMKARKVVAKALQKRTSVQEMDTVLDFFETLGILVRRHAVDKELAWNSFSYWVLRYAVFTRDHIDARRRAESDNTYWEEFEFLVDCFTQVETRKRHLKLPQSFSNVQLDKFLKEELSD